MREMGVRAAQAHELVRLSRAQNGALSADQLRAAGLSRDAIRARVQRGRLVRLFPRAFAAGDPQLMPLVRPSAALLSLGPNSLLSHRSAAGVWGLVEPSQDTIDVTVVGGNPKPRPGIRLHRVEQLHADDATTRSNLRLTALARTLMDFAAQASTSELQHAFGEARAKQRLTDAALKAALTRAPRNHPGAAIVRAVLREGGTYDRSSAERLLRRLCQEAQLPQPLVNVHLHGFLVDFLWPEANLIVEVDGYSTHGTRQAFETDRRRDQVHIAAGYVVLRVTWYQLLHEPMAVLARIAQALARRAA